MLSLSELLEPEEDEELDESFGLLGGSAPGSGVGLVLDRSGLIS